MANQTESTTNQRRLRPHQKSRGGCFRCKTKRIKCNEAKPRCYGCLRNAAQCVYFDGKALSRSIQIDTQHSFGFHLRDMRFFHNFMTVSWPHLPLEMGNAWRYEVPVVAQQHEFLMHGILSLGAAHLHAMTNLDLKDTVDRHRILAMRGLNSVSHAMESDTGDDAAADQMTAILAASYLLTFTATYMGDSLSFFLILVRACSSISKRIVQARLPSPLLPWHERATASASHLKLMQRRLRNATRLPPDEVEDGLASLERLERECTLMPFQEHLLRIMKAIFIFADQPSEAYRHFISIYSSLTDLPAEDFAIFTDNSNTASMVLQAHFLAAEALLRPWLQTEPNTRPQYAERDSMSALPSPITVGPHGKLQELSKWPMKFLERENMKRLMIR